MHATTVTSLQKCCHINNFFFLITDSKMFFILQIIITIPIILAVASMKEADVLMQPYVIRTKLTHSLLYFVFPSYNISGSINSFKLLIIA